MQNKRGLSEVIITVLIILISIAAIFLVWQFLKPTLKEEAGSINLDKVKVDLEINRNSLIASSVNDSFKINVIRNAGEGDLTKIKVRVENETNAAVYEFDGIPELGERQLSVPNTIANYAKIVVIPIVRVGNNEGEAGIADTLVIRDVETQEEVSCSLPSNLQCTLGTKQCKAGTNITQTCSYDSTSNCYTWVDSVTCIAPQFCLNGNCVNVVCSSNANCGSNVYSTNFCLNGNVYRNYTAFTCNNPGTLASSCSNTRTPVLNQTCSNGCSNGACNIASIPLSGCSILNQANGLYTLANNLNVGSLSADCINITANNVTLDCKGHSINGTWSSSLYFLISSSKNNSVIKNCNLSGAEGMFFNKVTNGQIFNNSINTNTYNGGIYLLYSTGINISKNSFPDGNIGIGLHYSNNNQLSDNYINSMMNYAVHLDKSSNNKISNLIIDNTNQGIFAEAFSNFNSFLNVFINRTNHGMEFVDSSNNYLNNITLLNPTGSYGLVFDNGGKNNIILNSRINAKGGYAYAGGIVTFYGADNCTISGNRIENLGYNGIGIQINSNSNTIQNNIVRDVNEGYGIYFTGSSYNLVIGNNLTNITARNFYYTGYGFYLGSLSNYNIIRNNFVLNANGTAFVFNSANNSIFNNYFNTSRGVYFDTPIYSNFWNTTLTSGTNIIGGSRIGGNYWAQINGQGFSQTCIDSNSDKICDSSYNLNTSNLDYSPLKN